MWKIRVFFRFFDLWPYLLMLVTMHQKGFFFSIDSFTLLSLSICLWLFSVSDFKKNGCNEYISCMSKLNIDRSIKVFNKITVQNCVQRVRQRVTWAKKWLTNTSLLFSVFASYWYCLELLELKAIGMTHYWKLDVMCAVCTWPGSSTNF